MDEEYVDDEPDTPPEPNMPQADQTPRNAKVPDEQEEDA